MMRKFQFEAEVYESLSCLPMVARRKLDELGIKIGFDDWGKLSRGERLMICHAPIASEDERGALRYFIDEVMARCGGQAKSLPENKRQGLKPPVAVPPQLVESAHAGGVALTQDAWSHFDDDQRYVLIKLGVEKQSHKLKAALAEFMKSTGSIGARPAGSAQRGPSENIKGDILWKASNSMTSKSCRARSARTTDPGASPSR